MGKYYTSEHRFTDKGANENERLNYYDWFREQMDLFGQKIEYFVYNYQLSAHDSIYGEQPTATYSHPITAVWFIELEETSLMLSKYGWQSEDEVTAYVPISSYSVLLSTAANERPEPKSGDVFRLVEYGDDRPGDRGGKSFEITQRVDQEIGTINPLMGHYVWMIKAKRLDYSFEPGLSADSKPSEAGASEKGQDQVTDDTFTGRLSGYTNPQTTTKVDNTNNADKDGSDVFDYGSFDDNDDVYGDYF